MLHIASNVSDHLPIMITFTARVEEFGKISRNNCESPLATILKRDKELVSEDSNKHLDTCSVELSVQTVCMVMKEACQCASGRKTSGIRRSKPKLAVWKAKISQLLK